MKIFFKHILYLHHHLRHKRTFHNTETLKWVQFNTTKIFKAFSQFSSFCANFWLKPSALGLDIYQLMLHGTSWTQCYDEKHVFIQRWWEINDASVFFLYSIGCFFLWSPSVSLSSETWNIPHTYVSFCMHVQAHTSFFRCNRHPLVWSSDRAVWAWMRRGLRDDRMRWMTALFLCWHKMDTLS